MGIFNMFLGGREAQAALDRQASEVLSALNTASREKEQMHKRMQAGIDAVSVPLLLADERHMLMHANPAAMRQLRATERELATALKGFAADKLVGSKLESLYPPSILQRAVFDSLTAARTDTLVIGGRQVLLTLSPLLDGQRQRIGTIVEWQDQTDQEHRNQQQAEQQAAETAAAAELEHLKSAVDAATVNVMVINTDNKITYANKTVLQMLSQAESEIRKGLPNFSAAQVVGSSMDIFHRNPSHQRNMLQSLTGAHKSSISIGARKFSLVANTITDGKGNRLGTVVEWQDRALEDAIEKIVNETVSAAADGDLTKRVELAGLYGSRAVLADGINKLMDNFEKIIKDVGVAVDAIAGGKLTDKIMQDYNGSFGVLKNAVNTTVDKLVEVVDEIRQGAVNVMHSTIEINSGNVNLSSRTEQQAASLEETSAAMEQITTTVQQNAANAIQANNLARGARETAENGGQVVSRAVAAMQAISESSNKINDIIGVIDEIAFQTNLLALNAAVEAARAGDQGRGFAVVADEVRNLAGRSAKAAKEIKELIKDSSEKVKEGSNLVNKSGETLDEIVTAVKKVNDIVAEISTASDEQATGLDEISRAVNEMDGMTQQNAALVEQNSSAGRTLDDQASALNAVISFFDTGHPSPLASTARKPEKTDSTARAASKPVAGKVKAGTRVAGKAAAPAPRASRPAVTSKPAVTGKPKHADVKPRAAARVKVDDEDKNWSEF